MGGDVGYTVDTNRDFDVVQVRKDFPILERKMHDKPLVFLDSAASSQKPDYVIQKMVHYYSQEYSNVHRGVYWLSDNLTNCYERSRETVKKFINANSPQEIIFTRGATEAINLVAASLGQTLKAGDEVCITELEHHSNIVPWQMLRQRSGIIIKVVPVSEKGEISLLDVERLISSKTKIVAVSHVSNVLGTILPIKEICAIAHKNGAVVLVDGCQGIVHQKVDVKDLDCDFYAFSSHKIYGPTGCGILYGKRELLELMPPYQGGGDMISNVTFEHTDWAELPAKFEAGTPAIVEGIGLGAAIDYFSSYNIEDVFGHEQKILDYATTRLSSIKGLRIIGESNTKVAVISFVVDGTHPHDLATVLDRSGVCVRAGHHCAQPLMDKFGVIATVRSSFAIYNTLEEVDALVSSIEKARDILC